MPTLLLTNANRLMNKLEELHILSTSNSKPDLIAITETWLSASITDDTINLRNYIAFRKDRVNRPGGGVMVYVRNNIQCSLISDVHNSDFEIIWLKLRPKILPRPFSVMILVVVYSPPWYNVENSKLLATSIVQSFDTVMRKFPNAAVILCGDFNNFNTDRFNRYLRLRPVYSEPTRGNNVLDKIFMNCNAYYSLTTDILPPLGRSDHNCVFLRSLLLTTLPSTGWKNITTRCLDELAIDAIGSELVNADWRRLYYCDDVQEQTNYFYHVLNDAIDKFAPLIERRVKNNDKPWITTYFRKVVDQRNHAFKTHQMVLYRKLRNKVNRLRRNLQKDFYFKQVSAFSAVNSHKWWKTIKSLCCLNNNKQTRELYGNMQFNNEPIDMHHMLDVVNDFFVSCSANVPGIDPNDLSSTRLANIIVPDDYIISEYSVFRALSSCKINKAAGPDNIPNKLICSLADVLCGPICSIINSSIRTGLVPTQFKIARVTPIPKLMPPVHIESDLRPISITSGIAKLTESFICKLFDKHFEPFLDENQFGCIKGRSTTFALIKFCHFLYSSLDNTDVFCRILFIDFSKAFDLINHNILLQKLRQHKFPPHLTAWLLSFLSNRSQYVQIGNSYSSVRPVNAGVPQGTLTGPNAFKLIINDLSFDSEYIKYVDDSTFADASDDPLDDKMQNMANHVFNWTVNNGMLLNVKKTKEMILYFGRKYPHSAIPNLTIGGEVVQRVSTFKLLGVVFNTDLTWNDHVDYILTKTSKRVHCITQLVHSGVDPKHIVTIYCSIVRSVLEYCCPVWHPGLTTLQSKNIERVQIRCLKIIFPSSSYSDALGLAHIERLDVRRERIVKELFQCIKNSDHILNKLIHERHLHGITNYRNVYKLKIPFTKHLRSRKDFITYCLYKKY